jgi:hypothetical protein
MRSSISIKVKLLEKLVSYLKNFSELNIEPEFVYIIRNLVWAIEQLVKISKGISDKTRKTKD